MAEVLGSRGLIIDPVYKICSREIESIENLFKGCEFAHNFWQQLQVPICTSSSFALPFKEWMETNYRDLTNAIVNGITWKIIFPLGIWQLWLHRNNYVFRTGIVDNQCWKKSLRHSAEFYVIGLEARIRPSKTIVLVGWEEPPRG